jgi:hypothetical protein
MTDDERTQLRIDAAKAMGWAVRESLHYPNMYWLAAPDNFCMARRETEQECWAYCPFKPLDNPADCESLLVATMIRGWWVRWTDFCMPPDDMRLRFSIEKVGYNKVETESDNPDTAAAYREAVVQACLAAWKAEQETGEDGQQ